MESALLTDGAREPLRHTQINSRAAFLLQGSGTTESPCFAISLACDVLA
jgi:hypothetical protein